ncbi:HDOD domain-containing protein [Zhongshania sp. BJYM1]|uniref:HDOD domain-containing protein n=1 Tax=Zhongshania aquatica TaxID=2965069 RepID=UPI0022B380BD|nr:HDOD domain-containing protein [Marortus sp. BJYM1]
MSNNERVDVSLSNPLIEQVRLDLLEAIENDSIVLPTLPEVALEIREAASDPDVNVGMLANIIENDSSIATRILRIANSSLLRGFQPIPDVKSAIGRIGLGYTSTLVTTLAMQQIFLSTKEALNQRMRAIWMHSTDVAAICNTLARSHTRLNPEMATLAGIVHQVGALPVLSYAVGRGFLRDHPDLLDQILISLSPEVGSRILEAWGFADELVMVPTEHMDFDREVPEADYVDLVMVANLHSYVGSEHPLASVDWSTVSAFERLGLPVTLDADDGYHQQIEQMQSLLRG